MSVIKEAYAGALYSLLIEGHVAKTRLVVDKDSVETPRFSIASKRIEHFEDLEDMRKRHREIEREFPAHGYGKQVIKVILAGLLLGEDDFNPGNLGFAGDKFIKIDHGMSMELKQYGHTLKSELDFTPEFLSQASGLSSDYFTEENIQEALTEMVEIIKRRTIKSDISLIPTNLSCLFTERNMALLCIFT